MGIFYNNSKKVQMFQNSNIIGRDGTNVDTPFAHLRYKRKVPLYEGGTYPRNWKNDIRTEVPTLSQDNRTQYEIEIANEYANKVNGPVSAGDVPYLLLEDPGRIFTGIDKEDAAEVNMITHNPYISEGERFKRKAGLAAVKAPAVLLNTTLGVGFAPAAAFEKAGIHTLGVVGNEIFNPLAGMNIGKNVTKFVTKAVDNYFDKRVLKKVAATDKIYPSMDIVDIFDQSFDYDFADNLPIGTKRLFKTGVGRGYLHRRLRDVAHNRLRKTDIQFENLLNSAPNKENITALLETFVHDFDVAPFEAKWIAEFIRDHHGFAMFLNKKGLFVKKHEVLNKMLDDKALFKEFYETYKYSARGVDVPKDIPDTMKEAVRRLVIGKQGWIGKGHYSSNSNFIKKQYAINKHDGTVGFTGILELKLPGLTYDNPARVNHQIISDNVKVVMKGDNEASRFKKGEVKVIEAAYGGSDGDVAERIVINFDENNDFLPLEEMEKSFKLSNVEKPEQLVDPNIDGKKGAWGLSHAIGDDEFFTFDADFLHRNMGDFNGPSAYTVKVVERLRETLKKNSKHPYTYSELSDVALSDKKGREAIEKYIDDTRSHENKFRAIKRERRLDIAAAKKGINNSIEQQQRYIKGGAAATAVTLAGVTGLVYGGSAVFPHIFSKDEEGLIWATKHRAYTDQYPNFYKILLKKSKDIGKKYAKEGKKPTHEQRKAMRAEREQWEKEWKAKHPLSPENAEKLEREIDSLKATFKK